MWDGHAHSRQLSLFMNSQTVLLMSSPCGDRAGWRSRCDVRTRQVRVWRGWSVRVGNVIAAPSIAQLEVATSVSSSCHHLRDRWRCWHTELVRFLTQLRSLTATFSSTLSSLSLGIHLRLALESKKSMTATSDLRQEARRFGFPCRLHLVNDWP